MLLSTEDSINQSYMQVVLAFVCLLYLTPNIIIAACALLEVQIIVCNIYFANMSLFGSLNDAGDDVMILNLLWLNVNNQNEGKYLKMDMYYVE